jgi:hypothetical protein
MIILRYKNARKMWSTAQLLLAFLRLKNCVKSVKFCHFLEWKMREKPSWSGPFSGEKGMTKVCFLFMKMST